MAEGNGKGRILSLDEAKRPLGKKGDFATVGHVEAMMTAMLGKIDEIHRHYLTQLPKFTASMIMDGLGAHGLLGLVECVSCGAISRIQKPDDGPLACRFCNAADGLKPLTPPELLATEDAVGPASVPPPAAS